MTLHLILFRKFKIKIMENTIKLIGYKATNIQNKVVPVGTQRFDNTRFCTEIPYLNGKFWTGLDKYSPNVFSIKDTVERENELTRVTEIRKDLEFKLGKSLDQDKEEGFEFLKSITIIIDNNELPMDLNDPYELLKYNIIMCNSKYNKSFRIKQSKKDVEIESGRQDSPDFYIENQELELKDEISKTRLKHKAIGLLANLREKDVDKLLLGLSYLLPSNKRITYKTNPDLAYQWGSAFLDSDKEFIIHNQQKNFSSFLEFFSLKDDEFDVRANVRKAIRYNIIRKDNSNNLYNVATLTVLGKTEEDVVKYFMDHSHKEEFGNNLKTNTNNNSIKSQIKNIEK